LMHEDEKRMRNTEPSDSRKKWHEEAKTQICFQTRSKTNISSEAFLDIPPKLR